MLPLPRLPPRPSGALSACAVRLDTDGDTAASFARGQPSALAGGGGAPPDNGGTPLFTAPRPGAFATAADSTTRSTTDRALSRSFSTRTPFGRFLRRASNQAFFSSSSRPRAARDSFYMHAQERANGRGAR